MIAEHTSLGARYSTLRDYLRVLRRYRLMIAVIAVLGAAAGLADALRQSAVYQATADVAFQDPTQGLGIVGLSAASAQTPAQLAAVNADTATRPAVIAQVKDTLKTARSVQSLTNAISTQVAVPSGLLQISARGSGPAFAASLANAVANVVIAQDNAQTHAEFAAAAKNIRKKISHLTALGARLPSSAQLGFYEDELARLDALGPFTKSAQLARIAQPPGSPISPRRVRSTILGLILGLLLGILFAFFRDSMDRRLRNPRDAEAAFNLPVLGHVRDGVMGHIPQIPNGSAADYRIDLEAFRILRRNIQFLDSERSPCSILVSSALPEEGKTTVAASLALAMASAGRLTLLVDCDLRRPALARRLRVEQSPGLSEFLEGEASPQEILRKVEFNDSPPTADGNSNGRTRQVRTHELVFIPSGGPTPRGSELLGSTRFRDFLQEVCDAYEVVVLDSSPLLPVADTLEILSHVDAVLLCAREHQTTRDQARAAKAALERFPERPSAVVITGVKPDDDDYDIYYSSYAYSEK